MFPTLDRPKTVHKSEDDHGTIEVIDEGMTRSLYFGTRFKQSSMLLDEPSSLLLDYTRAMLAPLPLLKRKPERILVCGLGGASQVKYLNALFPDAHIDIIELREAVIRIAVAYFSLRESPNNRFLNGNANEISKRLLEERRQYDLILLDIFTGNDIAPDLRTGNLLQNCRQLLANNGFCAINLWKNSRAYRDICSRLHSSFDHPAFILVVSGKQNVIHFGFKQPPDKTAISYACKNFHLQQQEENIFLLPYLRQLTGNLNPVTRLAHRLFGFT